MKSDMRMRMKKRHHFARSDLVEGLNVVLQDVTLIALRDKTGVLPPDTVSTEKAQARPRAYKWLR